MPTFLDINGTRGLGSRALPILIITQSRDRDCAITWQIFWSCATLKLCMLPATHGQFDRLPFFPPINGTLAETPSFFQPHRVRVSSNFLFALRWRVVTETSLFSYVGWISTSIIVFIRCLLILVFLLAIWSLLSWSLPIFRHMWGVVSESSSFFPPICDMLGEVFRIVPLTLDEASETPATFPPFAAHNAKIWCYTADSLNHSRTRFWYFEG